MKRQCSILTRRSTRRARTAFSGPRAGELRRWAANPLRLCPTSRRFGESDSLFAPIRRMAESDSWYHVLVLDGRSRFVYLRVGQTHIFSVPSMSLIVLNTRYAATILGLLCGALLGACRDAGAPDGERVFGVTPVPSVVRLAVGDSAVVTLVPFDTPVGATAGRVISRSLQPAVATVDTTGSAAPSPIGWRNARMCPRRSRTRRWRTVSPTLSRLPIGAQTFSNDAGC